ncbi:MAG: hypothetical protein AABW46_01515 [Nanoarchaeota archaeon]|mgnify:CR=1 FL=1
MEKQFLDQLSELNKEVKYSFRIMDSILLDLVNKKDIPRPNGKVKKSFWKMLIGG